VYMANKKQFEIDKEINKDNAKEKGYEWMIDMVYDPEKINEMVVEDFLGVYKNGYVFGMPASIEHNDRYLGIYRKKK